jgi:hypothetical protein
MFAGGACEDGIRPTMTAMMPIPPIAEGVWREAIEAENL